MPSTSTARLGLALACLLLTGALAPASESDNWKTLHPDWIWCDDFDQPSWDTAVKPLYFEQDVGNGTCTRASGVGLNGSTGLRIHFDAGTVGPGGLKVAFGKTPSTYFRPVDAGLANYREIYWRMYLKNQAGWTGGAGDKLSRALVMAGSNWAEAAFGHCWGGDNNELGLDPASGTDAAGNLMTTKYNDFANMRWLGWTSGATPLFDSAHVGIWHCVEVHMKLNDAGASNGIFEMWVDGALDAQKTGLNWLGSFNAYGINMVFFENYWNAGSPVAQDRFFDNLVVSTKPIGPVGTSTNRSPTVAPAAAASPNPVSAKTAALSVLGADDGGEANLAYTWSTTSTPPAAVTFSVNGSNAAKATTATFAMAGAYSFLVTIHDAGGLTATSSVSVTVTQTLTSLAVSPASASVATGGSQQFSASAKDQFGAALVTQPTVTWSVSGGGTFSGSGLFTAGTSAGGPFTVTAAGGGKGGTASVAVTAAAGTGLLGQYWTNQTGTFNGAPTLTRTDATVNFDWGYGSPASSVSADHFTVRWTGSVKPPSSGIWSFATVSDDGVRLWVNNQLLVNNWTDHSPTVNGGAIQLTGGQLYPIRMEYYENGGGATAKLLWSGPATPVTASQTATATASQGTPVPLEALYPAPLPIADDGPAGVSGGSSRCGLGAGVAVLGLMLIGARRLRVRRA